jgi:hypothetical protein
MDDVSLKLLLGSIAEQQYRFHLLAKLLIEKNLITSAELDAKFDENTKFQFSQELLEHLVATGLKIAGSSPSSLPQETPAASSEATKAAIDPESQTKS